MSFQRPNFLLWTKFYKLYIYIYIYIYMYIYVYICIYMYMYMSWQSSDLFILSIRRFFICDDHCQCVIQKFWFFSDNDHENTKTTHAYHLNLNKKIDTSFRQHTDFTKQKRPSHSRSFWFLVLVLPAFFLSTLSTLKIFLKGESWEN